MKGKPILKTKYKIYMRQCKKCNEIYNTTGKYSRICDKCKKPSGGDLRHLKRINLNNKKNI